MVTQNLTPAATAAEAPASAPSVWVINPAASRVEFTVGKRFLVVPLTVSGRVAGVEGTIAFDERDPSASRVDATVRVASVDTGNARRDKHLLAADFFDAERHPTLRLAAEGAELLGPGRGRVRAALTVRGVTRDVPFDVTYAVSGGRLSVAATARVDRRDFGLNWNRLPIGVKDAVTITLAAEATPARRD